MKSNQKAKTAQLTLIVKLKIVIKNPFTDPSNYEVIIVLKYALEAETETTIKPRSVVGIKTPLNTTFIASQNGRERNQKNSNKQEISVTPLLVKGTKP